MKKFLAAVLSLMIIGMAGVALAAELIDSGKALETLERFIAVSNRAEANA